MKEKLATILPDHTLIASDAPQLYIADYKDINRGDVQLLTIEPTDIKSVFIKNSKQIPVYFDGFKENALPIAIGLQSKQCECVLFPTSCGETDWILFVETKYANNLKLAFAKEADYPNGMINQIIETVQYFRDKGIIAQNRRVNAIVSFPNLIEAFDSTLFRKADLSIEDLLFKHRIRIRATNSATIKSEKRISLDSI